MNLNVIITTRDRPNKIAEGLDSIFNVIPDINAVFIIDDSVKKENITANDSICRKYSNSVVHFSSANLRNVNLQSPLNDIVKLGVPEWNLANGRNIGMLLSYAVSGSEFYTLFLDDDIILPKKFNVDLNTVEPAKLYQLNIQKCPDLSRMEWINYYILAQNSVNNMNFGYVNELFEDTASEAPYLLSKYTDLVRFDEIKINEQKSQKLFLTRQELSGGGFIASNDIFKISLFPSWFDEDWFWFEKIRGETNTTQKYLDVIINHNSDKKEVLNFESLCFEENGKILTNAALIDSQNDLLKLVNLKYEKEIKIQKIKGVIEQLTFIKKDNCCAEKIKDALCNLVNYIKSKDNLDYLNQVKKFELLNNYWKKEFIDVAKSLYVGVMQNAR